MPITRVQTALVTTPPQTTQAAPFIQDISFPDAWVEDIEIVIPDGHAGITGIAIAQAHQIVIPYSGNVWIVSNDEVLRFSYADGAGTGNWQAFTYNQDFVNPHSFYIRFFVSDINPAPLTTAALAIPAEDLVSAGSAASQGGELGSLELSALGEGVGQSGAFASPVETPGGALDTTSEQPLEQDIGLGEDTAGGLETGAPDLSQVQFAVAAPEYTQDAA